MYLRHTTRRKDGKTHVYWQLVRSIRRGRKVVQQMVAQLGELDGEGRARAEALARSIAGRASKSLQGQLFDRSEPSGGGQAGWGAAGAFAKFWGGLAGVDFVAGVKAR